MFDLVINEGVAINQVIDLVFQGFEGGVGGGRLQIGDLVVEEGGVNQFQFFIYYYEIFDGFLQLVQGILGRRLFMVSLRVYIVERWLMFMI